MQLFNCRMLIACLTKHIKGSQRASLVYFTHSRHIFPVLLLMRALSLPMSGIFVVEVTPEAEGRHSNYVKYSQSYICNTRRYASHLRCGHRRSIWQNLSVWELIYCRFGGNQNCRQQMSYHPSL